MESSSKISIHYVFNPFKGRLRSWEKGTFNQGLWYYVKYPHEYYSALISKNIFIKRGKWNAQSMREAQNKISRKI
ncbi:hypothetical protein [Maribacter antarcticus]|uniref:hypothetical protein n=1 Tax=Maribacter antarcticus TaxID=505250 RepID=UPI00047D3D48|nr:hypothetical protein [Maribacter antarcticus]